MAYLRNVFPNSSNIQLVNCIACELHVTLTQHPTNITYMRETIHTLELISADYFNFPRLVYPCPNLESLSKYTIFTVSSDQCHYLPVNIVFILITKGIEKPSNDVFNIDQQNVPFLYGNTIPFINLKHLKLSRISLTNLTHFLSRSQNLRKFKVTNIGRRERPRWTDQRIRQVSLVQQTRSLIVRLMSFCCTQILPPDSAPRLEDFHVSCLPNEGFSTSDTHRYYYMRLQVINVFLLFFYVLQVSAPD